MAETSPVEMAHDLGHYVRPLRRHIALIILCAIIGLLLGAIGALLKQPAYSAASRVYVQPTISDGSPNPTGGRTSGTVNMDTEAQAVKSLPVGTIAARLLHLPITPAALTGRVTVTVPPNTQVLKIAYTAHTAGDAIAGADAVANAYLQAREEAAVSLQNQQITTAESQLKSLRAQLVKDKIAYRAATVRSTQNDLFERVGSDQTQLASVSTQLGSVRTQSTFPGSIQTNGILGGSSPNQGRIIYVLAGIVLGVLAGVGLATFRERFDKTVRYEDDLTRDGVRLLAEIQPVSGSRRNRRAAQEAETLGRARAVQRLAASIGAALGDRGGSIYLAVLSTDALRDRLDEQLAAELSRFGSTTEIVTLGAAPAAHQPTMHVATLPEPPRIESPADDDFGYNDQPSTNGHHAELNGNSPLEMLGWPMPGAAVATRPTEAQPAPRETRREEVIEPARLEPMTPAVPVDDMTALLQQVQSGLGRARYVILTSTTPPGGSEAYVLASLSQVTVIAAETGVTSRTDLADAVEQVEITPSRILGGLLWRPRGKLSRSPFLPEEASASGRRRGKDASSNRGNLPVVKAKPAPFDAPAHGH